MLAILTIFQLCSGGYFVLTDIHYDIVYDENYNETYFCQSLSYSEGKLNPEPTTNTQPLVRPGCDSSLALVNATFSQMSEINPNPEFIIILGDSIGHFTSSLITSEGYMNKTLNMDLVKQSYVDLFDIVFHYFPNTQIIPSVGNNDAYIDYIMPEQWPKVEYYSFLYKLWLPLAGSISCSFFEGGYYLTTTSTGYNIIVLNTVYFSHKANQVIESDVQLLWLKNLLSKGKDNVIICMHIPPGIGIYHGGSAAWNEAYNVLFESIVSEYRENIISIYTGHYHSGFFQFISTIPVVIHPSVSPIFGNNPGFRYYESPEKNYYDFTLNSYSRVHEWQSYSFISQYGYSLNYTHLYQDLVSGAVSIQSYLPVMTGWWVLDTYNYTNMCMISFGNACKNKTELSILLCSITNQYFTDFQTCLKSNFINLS